jgi:hypothetical protein
MAWARYDFESMRAEEHRSTFGPPATKSDVLFSLRRRDGGVWERKMDLESWMTYMKRLQEKRDDTAKALPSFSRTYDDKLKEYGEGPFWENLGDELGARLETAYQRYVHQG